MRIPGKNIQDYLFPESVQKLNEEPFMLQKMDMFLTEARAEARAVQDPAAEHFREQNQQEVVPLGAPVGPLEQAGRVEFQVGMPVRVHLQARDL